MTKHGSRRKSKQKYKKKHSTKTTESNNASFDIKELIESLNLKYYVPYLSFFFFFTAIVTLFINGCIDVILLSILFVILTTSSALIYYKNKKEQDIPKDNVIESEIDEKDESNQKTHNSLVGTGTIIKQPQTTIESKSSLSKSDEKNSSPNKSKKIQKKADPQLVSESKPIKENPKLSKDFDYNKPYSTTKLQKEKQSSAENNQSDDLDSIGKHRGSPTEPTKPKKEQYQEYFGENNGKMKTIGRPKRSQSSCRPKIKEIVSCSQPVKPVSQDIGTYILEYDGNKKTYKFKNDSSLSSHMKFLKGSFEIDPKETVLLTFVRENGSEREIEDEEEPMRSFRKGTIRVSIKQKEKPKSESKPALNPKSDKIPEQKLIPKLKPKLKSNSISKNTKYFYEVMNEDEECEIELGSEATVKTMKEGIAKERDIDDISIIKIIFAGKELLNEIVLEPMDIGDTPLFIYIQPQEDVLLKTAKALRVINPEELEEEEEEDN